MKCFFTLHNVQITLNVFLEEPYVKFSQYWHYEKSVKEDSYSMINESNEGVGCKRRGICFNSIVTVFFILFFYWPKWLVN